MMKKMNRFAKPTVFDSMRFSKRAFVSCTQLCFLIYLQSDLTAFEKKKKFEHFRQPQEHKKY